MRGRKLIAGFFLRFAVIYALLMAAWPFAGAAYGAAFRLVSEIAFGELSRAASVRFEPIGSNSKYASSMDTAVVLRNHRTKARGDLPMSSRYLGYVPTAMVIALVVATPLPWRRRLRALLWALVLTQAFIGLRVLLKLLAVFSGSDALATFSLGNAGDATLAFLEVLITTSLTASYIGPIIIWIAVTFRAGDREMLARPKSDAAQ